jgi:hypothetical protein
VDGPGDWGPTAEEGSPRLCAPGARTFEMLRKRWPGASWVSAARALGAHSQRAGWDTRGRQWQGKGHKSGHSEDTSKSGHKVSLRQGPDRLGSQTCRLCLPSPPTASAARVAGFCPTLGRSSSNPLAVLPARTTCFATNRRGRLIQSELLKGVAASR